MSTSLYERIVPVAARLLTEGVFDPYILRAVFMGGGMGSGKSKVNTALFGTTAESSVSGFGLKSLSVDDIFMFAAKQHGWDPKTVLHEPKGKKLHDQSWYKMMARRGVFARARLGLVIDGTSKDPDYIHKGKAELEALGYDCSMVMVVTGMDEALRRNQARERTVPEADVRASHEMVSRAAKIYKRTFGQRYYEIENTRGFTPEEFKRHVAPKFHKMALKILNKPLANPKGKEWVAKQLEGASDHIANKVWKNLGVSSPPKAAS